MLNRQLGLFFGAVVLLTLPCRAAPAGSPACPAASAAPCEPGKLTLASPFSASLARAAQEFKVDPGELTWAELSRAFVSALGDPNLARADAQALIKANPPLAELGLKAIDLGGPRLWWFSTTSQARELFVQWQEVKAHFQGRRKPPLKTVSWLAQPLTVSPGAKIGDARTVNIWANKAGRSGNERPPETAVPAKKIAASATKPAGRYLIVVGQAAGGTGGAWLKSYRWSSGNLREDFGPFSHVPPYLLHDFSGKLSFSGSDLVFTVTPQPLVLSDQTTAISGGYKIALRLLDSGYALEGKLIEDAPYQAVHQFVQAVLQGRTDLAKAWLTDPKLASIPAYIGLSGKVRQDPMRVINMPGPSPAVYRFRLITFDKNDLIFDVSKPKTMWAIKAIFIAPPDPLLKKIARSLTPMESALPVPQLASPPPPAGSDKKPMPR